MIDNNIGFWIPAFAGMTMGEIQLPLVNPAKVGSRHYAMDTLSYNSNYEPFITQLA